MRYNVAVIGGGPSGMIAAISAAKLGAKVILLEKKQELGLKLLLAGGGRCNFSNLINNIKVLPEKFGPEGKFLYSAWYKFGPNDIVEFFNSKGLKTKVEDGGKVFPLSDSSLDVRDVLLSCLLKSKVKIMTSTEVSDFVFEKEKLNFVLLKGGEKILADNFIVCTGGLSYPMTGSSGEGYSFLKNMGHKISDLRPALSPVFVKDKKIKDLEGLSLKNVKFSLYSDCNKKGKEIISIIGDAIFTSNGLSGPAIFDISSKVSLLLLKNNKSVFLEIDFFPEFSFQILDEKIKSIILTSPKKIFKNLLSEIIPPKLILYIIRNYKIDFEKPGSETKKEERVAIVGFLKSFVLEVESVASYDRAMLTAGGVALDEVDPKTMRSKMIKNLFIAGEVLNIDGPTGGYNLQVCWSTGYLAGESAAQKSICSKQNYKL
ncbi:aminoacetone oxidase family FAD-binding enzyme [Candidatus Falkowbacteria bacterium HGW-Falkowbacteria-1]|uniref:Aminoacetone oxidase family FAD-binding enzyme n=1 Tax=Candidatus Falkowbacteria bacterium HGW-Falkowbacteria-1 TaxID=2013768 RepID=A0A2N2E9V9_9BACT|nr:MAG: aminoacetone oxidase family FAD-binding enzyme [Candidatus Falkowbacteria bacterium HGW-Falkowbacteria-1]